MKIMHVLRLCLALGICMFGASTFGSMTKKEVAQSFIDGVLCPAIYAFRKDVGRFPTQAESLRVLFRSDPRVIPAWRGPYLEPKLPLPKDPWGRLYIYVIPSSRSGWDFDLFSLGPDGIRSGDDIVRKGKPLLHSN